MELGSIRLASPAAAAMTAIALLVATPALALGDASRGKSVFSTQCSMCHTVNKGGPVILGPNLYGVVGRQAGTVKGYNYSPAMKAAGWIWNEDRLMAYIPGPQAMIPGIKMTYGGLHNPAQVADLVAFLATQK